MLLYETLSQPLIFIIMFSIGLGSGLLFDLRRYISFLCLKNKKVNIFLDIFFTIIVCGILFISNLYFNYGEFRFFSILAFIIGFTIQRFTLGMLVAKVSCLCYNYFVKIMARTYDKFKKKKKSTTEN